MSSCSNASCFVKRVVPFALAFLCGVAAWQLIGVKVQVLNDVLSLERGGRTSPRERRGTWAVARPGAEGSRTWLVIHSEPTVESVKPSGSDCSRCSVQLRVLFGEDGAAVPGNRFSVSSAAYPFIEDAVAAVKGIPFTPATENGKPIPLWANVTYDCGYRAMFSRRYTCRLWVNKESARTWDGRPWRVVYE